MLDDPNFAPVLFEDKDNFGGSVAENKIEKEVEGGEPTLKRCASYITNINSNSGFHERWNKEESDEIQDKYIPTKIKPLEKRWPRNNAKKHPSNGLKETITLKRLYNGISTSTEH